MKLDTGALEAFVLVAETGSFSRAAALLHLSQPALSRRLKKMEEQAGVRLIDRTTQRVALTSVGRAFLPQAQRLTLDLKAAAAVLGDVAGRRAGMVAVACIPTAAAHYLPAAIAEFGEQYPDIRVRVLDQSSTEVLQSVLQGAAEFGISFLGKMDLGVEFEPLLDDPLVVICRRDHPLARRRKVTWQQLAQHRVARVGLRSGTSLLLDLALGQLGIHLKWFHEVEYHFSSAVGLTEAGLAVTVLPQLAFAARSSSTLVARPLQDPPMRRLGLVCRKGVTASPAAEGLMDVLRSRRARNVS